MTLGSARRGLLLVGAALLGIGAALVFKDGNTALDNRRESPGINPLASHLYSIDGKVVRLSSVPSMRSSREVIFGIFSAGCVGCSGQIDAFLAAADAASDSGVRAIVIVATDAVGELSDSAAAALFGRRWGDPMVAFYRADRAMARSWGMRDYPALIRHTVRPAAQQAFLGDGPRFASAIDQLRHR